MLTFTSLFIYFMMAASQVALCHMEEDDLFSLLKPANARFATG